MRGLKKTAPDGADTQTYIHTDGHGDSRTNSAQRGRVGEKYVKGYDLVYLTKGEVGNTIVNT